VQLTLRALDIARTIGAKHFIGLGSHAEYGPCSDRILETHPTAPTTLYGRAKLASFLLAEGLCKLFGMRFAWLRLFSAYGPRDAPEWLIPYTTLQLLRGQRPALTRAEQRWDYIHVRDAAHAVLAVAESREASGVMNLGSGVAQPLRSVIEAVRDQISRDLPLGFGEVAYRPDQVMWLEASIDKVISLTGWRPLVNISDGIAETVSWYRDNIDRYSTTG
jgi:nucleoside-diphosphate-sugar epimerase